MPWFKPYPLNIFILLPAAAALLNTNWFGGSTLTAYFGFVIVASIVAFSIALGGIFNQPFQVILPLHIVVFLSLAAFLFLYGWIAGDVNLTVYYWATAGLFLICLYSIKALVDVRRLFLCIIILAWIESSLN
ncbi:MAG TPA: hypothetical protein VGN00_13130 [Puia sp.]|jgi:hypothetical protein